MNKYQQYVKTDELRLSRIAKRLTYKDMAEKLGFKTATSYYNIEVGKSMPTIEIMNNVSVILNKPVQNFFNIKVQQ